ncbi:DNA invertase Pin-like site-specific DNA recombinase [Microvirga flocculans]|uniref:DNA invertase Pin-like site-specific DNA recombinase n=1 Tax=Microvirga flocculans TaxID=217168 RepID=A0A7W6IHX5_9HYPH|nr:recombinase family protein [Microvirga flocculans]MBB4041810.1 DNA invertase Pin-like site-specific DNA recombinase [Microvirga flocculans]
MAKRPGEIVKATAYFRTSSASNVGIDKDSERRQREAVKAYAKLAGFEIIDEFYDAAVSGSDTIETRPGFSALLDRIEGNGVRVVLVEDASRLARSVLVQELAILALKARDVRVLAANGDDLTETNDEMKVAMRQIAGAFAQLEKTRLVKKLRAARERKRATGMKVEGRKSHAETRPEVVAEAKRLRRRSPKTGQRRSLREIADELARQGFTSASGRPFSSSVVKAMVES